MSTFFTIGEIAKLHNISVQTIRHYEKKNLIKPSYINSETGYRYFTIKQFVVLDLIKQCKAMGLSLEEIKIIIDNYKSFDSVLSIISNQKNIIDSKIQELLSIRDNVTFLEFNIKQTLAEGIDNVFVKENYERKFIRYNNTKRYTDEFEINLSKIYTYIQEKYRSTSRILAFSMSYKDLKEGKGLTYNDFLIGINEVGKLKEKDIITMPHGKYLTLNFDDDYNDTSSYYKKIMDYIDSNGIKVVGDFYESYIMTRVGADGKERSLGRIEILIKE